LASINAFFESRAVASVRWFSVQEVHDCLSAEQPGFQFESDTPPDPKANLISVLGRCEERRFLQLSWRAKTNPSEALTALASRSCVC